MDSVIGAPCKHGSAAPFCDKCEIESLRAQLTEAKALVLEEAAGYQADIERYHQQLADLAEDDQAKAVRIRELEARSGKHCGLCDDTRDIHSPDGEWRGECPECTSAPAAKVPEGWAITEDSLSGSIFLTETNSDHRSLFTANGSTRKNRQAHKFLKAMLSAAQEQGE